MSSNHPLAYAGPRPLWMVRGPRRGTWLYAGAAAAALLVALLLIGLASLWVPARGVGLRNWLILLFQLNGGVGTLPANPLRILNAVDVLALALVAVTFASYSSVVRTRARQVLLLLAALLPVVGTVVLFATHLAGRSAVMAGGLLVALALAKTPRHGAALAALGAVGNALLLAGDFATGTGNGKAVAAVVAIGYLCDTVWFAMLGATLLNAAGAAQERENPVALGLEQRAGEARRLGDRTAEAVTRATRDKYPLRRLYATAGGAAFLYVLMVLAPVVLVFAAPPVPAAGGAEVLEYIAAHEAVYVVQLLCFVGLSVPALVVFVALAWSLRRAAPTLAALGGAVRRGLGNHRVGPGQ